LRDDFLYCTNPKSCVRSKVGELEHFIKTVECDGFGERLIAQLYENGLVTEPADFYTLTKEELLGLERMGDKLATKLLRNIEDRKELDLDVFLRSLGIRELGKHASKILAGFGTLEKVRKLTEEELAGIHTIGEVIAREVVEGLKTKRPVIEKLLEHVRVKSAPAHKKEGALSGKSFLFTGSMVAMERKEAQKLVEEEGGTAAQSVTRDLDYLVVGDGGGAGSKLAKAEALKAKGGKVEIMKEKDFLKMIGWKEK
jgi:DNA ligase (NAD+)